MSKKIDTKYVGKIKVEESEMITFSSGLPGFNDEKSFVLLDLPGNPTFQILQSSTTPDLAFVVANPYHFYQDYMFTLDEAILESLQIKEEKDVTVLTIVTLKSPFKASTLNLKAPIIIHATRKKGKQYILNHEQYVTKAPIVSPHTTAGVKGD